MLLAHQVTVVNDISQAESVLHKQSIDSVILDLSLRNIQDFEMISSIYSVLKNAAIIVISKNQDQAILQQIIQLGADEVLDINKIDAHHFQRILISTIERHKRAFNSEIEHVNKISSQSKDNEKARWRFLSEATFEGII